MAQTSPKETRTPFENAVHAKAAQLRSTDECDLSTQLLAALEAATQSIRDTSSAIRDLSASDIAKCTSPEIHPDAVVLDVVKGYLNDATKVAERAPTEP